MSFADFYRERLQCRAHQPGWPRPDHPSDVVLHLPVLAWFAARCDTVLELGARDCHSTAAFLAGCRGKVLSVDLVESAEARRLRALELPCAWELRLGDDLDAGLVPEAHFDLVFFDTLHTHAHLARELRLYGPRAGQYLAFHDTATCADRDVSGPDPSAEGIGRAVREWVGQGGWSVAYESTVCNGILVLQKIP